MRKLFVILAVALSLGGCAQLQQALEAGKLVTASYANPVTRDNLNAVENGLIIAFAALNAYKQSCIKGAAEVHCKDNIAKIQAYTKRMPPLLAQLRTFVKNNDQINAIVVYNQIKDLITNFRSAAVAAGVPIGG